MCSLSLLRSSHRLIIASRTHYIGPLYDKAIEVFKIGKALFNYVTYIPYEG